MRKMRGLVIKGAICGILIMKTLVCLDTLFSINIHGKQNSDYSLGL